MTSLTSFFKAFLSGFKQWVRDFKQMLSLLLVCSLQLGQAAFGNTPPASIFDVMNHREVLELTLESDFAKLKADRKNEEEQPAMLRFEDASGNIQAWDIKVELRGKFRRMKCADIPPLKLNFKKKDLAAAGLAPFDDLKLVPQCVEDKALAEDYLKREYIAYRLYNELSPYSFRVQLLRITYIDSGTGERSKQWAFVVEDAAQLKARFGATECEQCFNLPQERFHAQATRIVSVFQYLIGNFDWSLANAKNVKLLLINEKVVPVPYDFDFSGLVNPDYAAAEPSLGMTHRRERVFLGLEEDADNLHGAINVVTSHREKFEDIVLNAKYLTARSKQDVLGYLYQFFEAPLVIKRPEKVAAAE